MREKLRFLGLDVHAETIAVAVAEPDGEVRSLGTIANREDSVRKFIKKLGPAEQLRACYEAGPTGFVLYWQLTQLGVECAVVAPSLVPKKPGDRVKTDRRDALKLARSHRSGDLTAVWVPERRLQWQAHSKRRHYQGRQRAPQTHRGGIGVELPTPAPRRGQAAQTTARGSGRDHRNSLEGTESPAQALHEADHGRQGSEEDHDCSRTRTAGFHLGHRHQGRSGVPAATGRITGTEGQKQELSKEGKDKDRTFNEQSYPNRGQGQPQPEQARRRILGGRLRQAQPDSRQ